MIGANDQSKKKKCGLVEAKIIIKESPYTESDLQPKELASCPANSATGASATLTSTLDNLLEIAAIIEPKKSLKTVTVTVMSCMTSVNYFGFY